MDLSPSAKPGAPPHLARHPIALAQSLLLISQQDSFSEQSGPAIDAITGAACTGPANCKGAAQSASAKSAHRTVLNTHMPAKAFIPF